MYIFCILLEFKLITQAVSLLTSYNDPSVKVNCINDILHQLVETIPAIPLKCLFVNPGELAKLSCKTISRD